MNTWQALKKIFLDQDMQTVPALSDMKQYCSSVEEYKELLVAQNNCDKIAQKLDTKKIKKAVKKYNIENNVNQEISDNKELSKNGKEDREIGE